METTRKRKRGKVNTEPEMKRGKGRRQKNFCNSEREAGTDGTCNTKGEIDGTDRIDGTDGTDGTLRFMREP
jgi:hypothetical protein